MKHKNLNCKKILYLGLDPTRFVHEGELVHVPLIEIVPRDYAGELKQAFECLAEYTHVIITSPAAAKLYAHHASARQRSKVYVSVGKGTTQVLQQHGIEVAYTAPHPCAEGIVSLLKELDLTSAHLFFPRSSLGRSVIGDYCTTHHIKLTMIDLYDTRPTHHPLPDLSQFDEIVFTSPSTVHAFFARAPHHPDRAQCLAIGPITQRTLDGYWHLHL